jgi:hypothetical protein
MQRDFSACTLSEFARLSRQHLHVVEPVERAFQPHVRQDEIAGNVGTMREIDNERYVVDGQPYSPNAASLERSSDGRYGGIRHRARFEAAVQAKTNA